MYLVCVSVCVSVGVRVEGRGQVNITQPHITLLAVNRIVWRGGKCDAALCDGKHSVMVLYSGWCSGIV